MEKGVSWEHLTTLRLPMYRFVVMCVCVCVGGGNRGGKVVKMALSAYSTPRYPQASASGDREVRVASCKCVMASEVYF